MEICPEGIYDLWKQFEETRRQVRSELYSKLLAVTKRLEELSEYRAGDESILRTLYKEMAYYFEGRLELERAMDKYFESQEYFYRDRVENDLGFLAPDNPTYRVERKTLDSDCSYDTKMFGRRTKLAANDEESSIEFIKLIEEKRELELQITNLHKIFKDPTLSKKQKEFFRDALNELDKNLEDSRQAMIALHSRKPKKQVLATFADLNKDYLKEFL